MANDKETVLSVKGLSKTIRGRHIVRNVTFEVKAGEIFGFLGPNGAGKTTTIRMLVGLIRPSQGTVKIGGHDLQKDFLQAIRHVGCIVENPELYPYLTGRENLEVLARMAEIPDDRIDEVVQLVELSDRIHDPVKTYSLGMRQRLGIAQALLGNPRLLILDEPTNGLDPAGIRELRAFIRKLSREEGISFLISSHILHEVQLMCDRVAVIHQGEIIRTGPIHQLVGQSSMVEWKVEPIKRGMQLLKSLSHIKQLESTPTGKVLVHMPTEKIAETNAFLMQQGVQVFEIRPYRPTLEDIFLEMTGGVQRG
jgi:ABC-2 type transport system ATP-binding protein